MQVELSVIQLAILHDLVMEECWRVEAIPGMPGTLDEDTGNLYSELCELDGMLKGLVMPTRPLPPEIEKMFAGEEPVSVSIIKSLEEAFAEKN